MRVALLTAAIANETFCPFSVASSELFDGTERVDLVNAHGEDVFEQFKVTVSLMSKLTILHVTCIGIDLDTACNVKLTHHRIGLQLLLLIILIVIIRVVICGGVVGAKLGSLTSLATNEVNFRNRPNA